MGSTLLLPAVHGVAGMIVGEFWGRSSKQSGALRGKEPRMRRKIQEFTRSPVHSHPAEKWFFPPKKSGWSLQSLLADADGRNGSAGNPMACRFSLALGGLQSRNSIALPSLLPYWSSMARVWLERV